MLKNYHHEEVKYREGRDTHRNTALNLLLVEQYNPEYIQCSQSLTIKIVTSGVDIQQLPTATCESPFIHPGYRMSGGTSHVTT